MAQRRKYDHEEILLLRRQGKTVKDIAAQIKAPARAVDQVIYWHKKREATPAKVNSNDRKLTEQDVIKIAKQRSSGEKIADIAISYGLSAQAVHSVLHGKTYNGLGKALPKKKVKYKTHKPHKPHEFLGAKRSEVYKTIETLIKDGKKNKDIQTITGYNYNSIMYVRTRQNKDTPSKKDGAKPTGEFFTDSNGNVYPVMISKKGRLFYVRTSKTGKSYNTYIQSL